MVKIAQNTVIEPLLDVVVIKIVFTKTLDYFTLQPWLTIYSYFQSGFSFISFPSQAKTEKIPDFKIKDQSRFRKKEKYLNGHSWNKVRNKSGI